MEVTNSLKQKGNLFWFIFRKENNIPNYYNQLKKDKMEGKLVKTGMNRRGVL